MPEFQTKPDFPPAHRQPPNQVCPACEQYKPGWPEDWQNRPNRPGGLRYVCKSCGERLPPDPGLQHVMVERISRLKTALELVLPLAKGYAADHRVESNDRYCQIAEQALAEAADVECKQ